MGFQGHRVGRVAGGGLYNDYKTKPRQQDWSDGATVKVGFLTLEVVEKVGGDYRLRSPTSGKKYTFTPHEGINSGWF